MRPETAIFRRRAMSAGSSMDCWTAQAHLSFPRGLRQSPTTWTVRIGFLFALRPRSLAPDRLEFDVNVTGFFTAINNLVGSWEDPLPIRELVESVRLEFEALLPAYNRLFG
jgi:hypothetical protein